MAKDLQEIKSTKTDKEPINMLELDKPASYVGSDEEKELAAFV